MSMSGQFVLLGSGCASPCGQSHMTWSDFLESDQHWRLNGLRLAKDGA